MTILLQLHDVEGNDNSKTKIELMRERVTPHTYKHSISQQQALRHN